MVGLFFVIGLLYGGMVDFGAFGGLNFIDGGNWFIYGILGGFIGKFLKVGERQMVINEKN